MLTVPTSFVPQSCPGLGAKKIENNLFCPVPTFYENSPFCPISTLLCAPALDWGTFTLLSFIMHGTSNSSSPSLLIFQPAEIYQQFPGQYVLRCCLKSVVSNLVILKPEIAIWSNCACYEARNRNLVKLFML